MKLEQKIASLLTAKKQTLAVAESCTGGLLANTLTNVPGSSVFFMLGVVTYSNAAKTKTLKIPAAVIKKHGAVSAAVAQRMAQGVRRILKTDIGIGVTGIAGPTGASATKPVGLTYIAISQGKKDAVFEYRFKGSRVANKQQAVKAALQIILKFTSLQPTFKYNT